MPPGHRTLLSREEDGVSYVPAELVTARLSGERTREKQLTPSPRDIEVIAEQVKQETVKDIRFVSRGREKNSDDRKNEEQLDEVLKRLSRQQKELEQLKQIQARLIRSTEPGRMAEVVMKQFKGQLQIEKLRKGG